MLTKGLADADGSDFELAVVDPLFSVVAASLGASPLDEVGRLPAEANDFFSSSLAALF